MNITLNIALTLVLLFIMVGFIICLSEEIAAGRSLSEDVFWHRVLRIVSVIGAALIIYKIWN